jgi:hypothetical protein
MPWLTICWKSRMPSPSIFLRSDSLFSRSTRNLYSSAMYYCSVLRLMAATMAAGSSMPATSIS